MRGHFKNVSGKGHFDVTVRGSEFSPAVNIDQTTGFWAAATEVDATDDPISGGAHVTVQPVVPANNNSVIVRLWVDAVPNPINVRLTAFVE